MNLKDTLSRLAVLPIDNSFVSKVEALYKTSIPDIVKSVLSISKETTFYDDFSLLRVLSNDEILNASSDMAVDFLGKHILPVIDVGDNDYIVYDLEEKCWYKFNIVDEIKFSKAISLSEYL